MLTVNELVLTSRPEFPEYFGSCKWKRSRNRAVAGGGHQFQGKSPGNEVGELEQSGHFIFT